MRLPPAVVADSEAIFDGSPGVATKLEIVKPVFFVAPFTKEETCGVIVRLSKVIGFDIILKFVNVFKLKLQLNTIERTVHEGVSFKLVNGVVSATPEAFHPSLKIWMFAPRH